MAALTEQQEAAGWHSRAGGGQGAAGPACCGAVLCGRSHGKHRVRDDKGGRAALRTLRHTALL